MSWFLLTDADGLAAHASKGDAVALLVTRSEIERGTVGDVVDRLMVLSDSRENVVRFAHQVALVVDGYDHDPRELVQIPEVVAFFRAVDAAWPYWLHFMSPEHESLQLALHLLVDLTPVRASGGEVGYAFDREELIEVVNRRLHAMNLLHHEHALPESRRTEISRSALSALSSSLV